MSDDEEVDALEEDYYSFLNISREATQDEINNAYRRLSRIYHPDKHTDPEKKKQADILFSKTKKAYEVLSDPHKRVIYDSLGVRGLETDGWEVVQRTRTPQEIREEYERLAREREQRRLEQRTNPKGSFTVNLNATSLFPVYNDEYEEYESYQVASSLWDVEVGGMSFSQSIEAPLTISDTATLRGHLSTANGTGSGSITGSVRRITSPKGWTELEVQAGNGLLLTASGYRNLSQRVFCNYGIMGAVERDSTSVSLRPGLVASLGTQLDKETMGYLTWKEGLASGLTTRVVRDNDTRYISASIHLGIPHSFASFSYIRKIKADELKLRGSIEIGTFGGNLEYGIEKKISKFSFLRASVSIGIPSGVMLKIRLSRSTQIYNFPIHLCEDIMPSPILYATVAPLGLYLIVTKLIVEPFQKRQKTLEIEKQKEQYKSKLVEKRREAEASIELMRATYERVVVAEEGRKGLVITEALYGRLVGDAGAGSPEVICVTIPLQCLVKDSKLILHENSKAQLPGFFDPCVGEDKLLKISYLFRGLSHEVTVSDTESLRIPRQSHRVNGT